MEIIDRFIRYVKINTQSNKNVKTNPTSQGQIILAKLLIEELNEFGIDNVIYDKHGIVYAEIKSNVSYETETVGFIAHLDTSPSFTSDNVNPNIINLYDAKDIILDKENNIILSPEKFPSLNNHKGKTLIVTDGKTLLGADDKAGVAEIMEFIKKIVNDDTIKHGKIKIAFTPDEECGNGIKNIDLKIFDCDYAYTIDGEEIGLVQYENFNAGKIEVSIEGVVSHLGNAKNKLINSQLIAFELNSMLPSNELPELTEGYEGYSHLDQVSGNVKKTCMTYLVRNHDKNKFLKQINNFFDIKDKINEKYKKEIIKITYKDSYPNMNFAMKDKFYVVMQVIESYKELGIASKVLPIRGGTDGAILSLMNLFAPNIGVGGYNFHSNYEYCVVEDMEKVVDILILLIKKISERGCI